MARFGNENAGTSHNEWSSSQSFGSRFLCPEDGTLEQIVVEIGDQEDGDGINCAIYEDDGGLPGALIAQGSGQAMTYNAWNSVPVSATLTANTYYWLYVRSNGHYRPGMTGQADSLGYSNVKHVAYPDFKDPAGASLYDYLLSIYAEYTPTGGGSIYEEQATSGFGLSAADGGKVSMGATCADQAFTSDSERAALSLLAAGAEAIDLNAADGGRLGLYPVQHAGFDLGAEADISSILKGISVDGMRLGVTARLSLISQRLAKAGIQVNATALLFAQAYIEALAADGIGLNAQQELRLLIDSALSDYMQANDGAYAFLQSIQQVLSVDGVRLSALSAPLLYAYGYNKARIKLSDTAALHIITALQALDRLGLQADGVLNVVMTALGVSTAGTSSGAIGGVVRQLALAVHSGFSDSSASSMQALLDVLATAGVRIQSEAHNTAETELLARCGMSGGASSGASAALLAKALSGPQLSNVLAAGLLYVQVAESGVSLKDVSVSVRPDMAMGILHITIRGKQASIGFKVAAPNLSAMSKQAGIGASFKGAAIKPAGLQAKVKAKSKPQE